MSAIDTVDHVHAANMFGMPVYWIIEKCTMGSVTDFHDDENYEMDKNYVSLGGGGGEHPALIMTIDGALLNLLSLIDIDELMAQDLSKSDMDLLQKIDSFYEKTMDDDIDMDNMNKNHWPAMAFVNMYLKMEKVYVNEMKDKSLEKKMNCALAMFVLNYMPLEHCIEDNDLRHIAQKLLISDISFLNEDLMRSMEMFEVATKGNCAGKIIENGKVRWGYCLEDFRSDN